MSPRARVPTILAGFRISLERAATVGMLIASAAITFGVAWPFWPAGTSGPQEETSQVVIGDDVSGKLPPTTTSTTTKGDRGARLVLIEFADFEYRACALFARDTFSAIQREFIETGKVLYVFRHFPLPIHRRAFTAAEAAECAGEQGRFWEMHDGLFSDQSALTRQDLVQRAGSMGLKEASFRKCLEGRAADKIREDLLEGGRLMVRLTPTFLIGRIEPDGRINIVRRFSGAYPLSAFRTVLQQHLETGD